MKRLDKKKEFVGKEMLKSLLVRSQKMTGKPATLPSLKKLNNTGNMGDR